MFKHQILNRVNLKLNSALIQLQIKEGILLKKGGKVKKPKKPKREILKAKN